MLRVLGRMEDASRLPEGQLEHNQLFLFLVLPMQDSGFFENVCIVVDVPIEQVLQWPGRSDIFHLVSETVDFYQSLQHADSAIFELRDVFRVDLVLEVVVQSVGYILVQENALIAQTASVAILRNLVENLRLYTVTSVFERNI